MSPDTRAMQDNDRANPAMLWVAEGERLWRAPPAEGARACSGCHGDATQTMRGVAARHPVFDAQTQQGIDVQGRIQQCRTTRQNQPPFAYESRPLLALASYIGLQSRGLPMEPPDDERLQAARAAGSKLFNTRLGQLNLSCAQCHDDLWGRKLGASTIPQGHPNGYPIYRLEWQGVGSLQRRLRNCMTGIRAEPFAYGAAELIALELYLADRARGMNIETPAVRP
ncbi:MAG: sulfur oxidation c-type cytochrome SoxA [Beijerinckiaceae bacterium]